MINKDAIIDTRQKTAILLDVPPASQYSLYLDKIKDEANAIQEATSEALSNIEESNRTALENIGEVINAKNSANNSATIATDKANIVSQKAQEVADNVILAERYKNESFATTPTGYQTLVTEHNDVIDTSAICLKRIAEAKQRQSILLQALAKDNYDEYITSWEDVQRIVRMGYADKIFNIGDQLIVQWKDVVSNITYDVPLDIVHFDDVELEDGEVVKGMFLQWHYTTPFDVQFDNYEAMYFATNELSAGTYNFTIPTTWSKALAGTYQFTLTNSVPQGGQIAGLERLADTEPNTWTIKTFANSSATVPIETANVTVGNSGVDLGNLVPSGNFQLNSIQRVGYGYNRWKDSAYRQFLNSKASVGNWWIQQHNYDRPPNQLTTKAGFMSGFSDDFLNVIAKIKIETATNTVTDGGITDTTYDKFFLASLEQEYCVPQVSGVEGKVWEYWKRAKAIPNPQASGSANALENSKRYAINSKTSSQYVRLRSSSRGSANYTWYVSSTGDIGYNSSYNANRSAPACVIA